MKLRRDSIKFTAKILCLVILLIAGYIRNNQVESAANKGAVDLIINNEANDQTPTSNPISPSKINV